MPTRRRGGGWLRVGAALAVLLTTTFIAPAAGASAKRDDAIEKKAVLKRSDFPSGWSSEPSTSSEPPAIPACTDLRTVAKALQPQSAESPDFLQSDITRAANSVVVLSSAKKAKSYLAPYRDDTAATCLEAAVRKAFDDPSIASVRVNVVPDNDTPTGANEAAGFQMLVTATSAPTASQPAETAVIYYDLLVVRVGRALTSLQFSDLGHPLPEQAELIDAVIGRLQDAGL